MILQADIILSNVNDGQPGEDGKSGVSLFKSYAFRRTDSDISGQQPTGGTWDNPVPAGWSDGIPAGTETLWQTVSTFKKDADGNTSNTAWTKPARVGNTSDRVLATGIDIEERKVTVTADKFKIIDNAGNDMMSVEKSGASSRVRLRNLMISGLTLREVVTLNTWSELRKYFSFDVQTLAGVTTATSTLNFQTCLNTFKLGNGCLVGRESGDTQDWNYQLNIVLPCKTYSASPTDADLTEMDNAMMYVGNRVILLNQSGRGISIFGRQEVEHMTTYLITSTNKGTVVRVVSSSAKPSLAISKGTNLDKTDGRSYSTWNGSLTDTRGYYVPTIQSDGVTVKYKYTKYWTTDESWYVPNGWFAVMECVCDVDAEYAQDEYSNKEPVQGQSVFWRVKVGKMLTK